MVSVFTASFVYSVVGGSRDMVMINVANEVGERRGGEWGVGDGDEVRIDGWRERGRNRAGGRDGSEERWCGGHKIAMESGSDQR